MRMLAVASILVCNLVVSSGCFTAAKRGLAELKGASSDAVAVPGTATGSFARFAGADIRSPHSNLGGLVDAEFISLLRNALRTQLVSDKEAPFPGGAPTLTIDPEILWYSKSGAGGTILGSDSYAVCLFWLSEGNTPLGKVQVVTKEAAVTAGKAEMAKSMAGGLVKFFEKHGKGKKDD